MKQVIGITGGIATGKSTVTNYIRSKGYPVIDADNLVHELQAKGGPLYMVLVVQLGQDILAPSGELDRKRLSERFFSDNQLRQELSGLQNDIIRRELLLRRDGLLARHDVIFMDIPLLFELDYQKEVDCVWLVSLDAERQLKRLKERNGYTTEQAKRRIAAQLSLERKKRLAHVIIDNSGTLAETYQQLDRLLDELGN
ncbi:dephospho-CoA kinase [Streptococcus suis]|nr:dephospho-CoA kinase [Streptococcus suis]